MTEPYSTREIEDLKWQLDNPEYRTEDQIRVERLLATVKDLNARLDACYKIATEDIRSTPVTEDGMEELARMLEAAICD